MASSEASMASSEVSLMEIGSRHSNFSYTPSISSSEVSLEETSGRRSLEETFERLHLSEPGSRQEVKSQEPPKTGPGSSRLPK